MARGNIPEPHSDMDIQGTKQTYQDTSIWNIGFERAAIYNAETWTLKEVQKNRFTSSWEVFFEENWRSHTSKQNPEQGNLR